MTFQNFPKLTSGDCDGLGCGWKPPFCRCSAHLEMKLEFQKRFNKPWREATKQEIELWEGGWEVGTRPFFKLK